MKSHAEPNYSKLCCRIESRNEAENKNQLPGGPKSSQAKHVFTDAYCRAQSFPGFNPHVSVIVNINLSQGIVCIADENCAA
jgi:hypothetical protein